jgi:hypothetical protein
MGILFSSRKSRGKLCESLREEGQLLKDQSFASWTGCSSCAPCTWSGAYAAASVSANFNGQDEYTANGHLSGYMRHRSARIGEKRAVKLLKPGVFKDIALINLEKVKI